MWYHAPGSRRHPFADIGDEWEQLSEQPRPRLGRRESEPHNDEVTYLMLVLRANFPEQEKQRAELAETMIQRYRERFGEL